MFSPDGWECDNGRVEVSFEATFQDCILGLDDTVREKNEG